MSGGRKPSLLSGYYCFAFQPSALEILFILAAFRQPVADLNSVLEVVTYPEHKHLISAIAFDSEGLGFILGSSNKLSSV